MSDPAIERIIDAPARAAERKKREEVEAALKAQHGRVTAVECANGDVAYFRRSTASEWLEQSVIADPVLKVQAFEPFVQSLFLRSLREATYESLLDEEGPGVVHGAWGRAVNALAGAGARPTRFL